MKIKILMACGCGAQVQATTIEFGTIAFSYEDSDYETTTTMTADVVCENCGARVTEEMVVEDSRLDRLSINRFDVAADGTVRS